MCSKKKGDSGPSNYLRAVALSLCTANKLRGSGREVRLLLVNCSTLTANQVLVWPTLESAHSLGARIDVLSLTTCNILKYLTESTRGFYREPTLTKITECLLMDFLLDRKSQAVLYVNPALEVNFMVDCLCCGKPRKLVLLCSVCLSIYCPEAGKVVKRQCRVCHTIYDT